MQQEANRFAVNSYLYGTGDLAALQKAAQAAVSGKCEPAPQKPAAKTSRRRAPPSPAASGEVEAVTPARARETWPARFKQAFAAEAPIQILLVATGSPACRGQRSVGFLRHPGPAGAPAARCSYGRRFDDAHGKLAVESRQA